MGKVVAEFIKTQLKDNPNFTYIENPTGFIYAQVACNTILGIHGRFAYFGLFSVTHASIPEVSKILMEARLESIRSVSYTHLDVYKRQVLTGEAE